MRVALAAGVLLTVAAGPARADGGSLEVAAGIAVPIAEDEYADNYDEALKLALRGVMGTAGRSAFELGFDWTPASYANPAVPGLDVEIDRFRILFGGRFGAPIGTRARVFGRAAAGVDVISASASATILGTTFEQSERDVGFALELGAGIAVDLGPIELGAQVALPLGFHFDDDDPEDDGDFALDYTAVDLDFLVFAAIGF